MIRSKNLEKTKYQEKLMRFLDPLKPYYIESKAGLVIGETSAHYTDKVAHMEGYSRPLWGLAPFWAGGGCNGEFEEIYRMGLINGTNPSHADYWGTCNDYDQKLVEMAAIAYGILLAPERIWNPLSNIEKDNLVNWLSEMNKNECADCNWKFFHLLVNIALMKVKRNHNQEQCNINLDAIESWYLGNGWYVDGTNDQSDYYIPFAMHFYGLVYAIYMKKEDPKRSQMYLDRAVSFGKDFALWFADNGSAIPYGRSLTYRFAQVSFFSMCVVAGIEPLPLGEIKEIIYKNLEYWETLPICDRAGLLSIGYAYPNIHVAESYNAPGSPYWAMKAFAFLALPDEHPFWTQERRVPQREEGCYYMKAPNFFVQRHKKEVYLLPGGRKKPYLHTHTDDKYSKFVYSTKYGFSVPKSQRSVEEAAPDNVLSFFVYGHIFTRRYCEQITTIEHGHTSIWSPLEGILVETTIIPTNKGHIRRHSITSEIECIAYDSGFATSVLEKDNTLIQSNVGNGKHRLIVNHVNTSILFSKTQMQTIMYAIHKGVNSIETEQFYE